ncbi:MAG: hypothetical protein IKB99_04695 [Lentisphaeria bacterium]|nr:hypothetical protein [Lentisphaeria bacterium]
MFILFPTGKGIFFAEIFTLCSIGENSPEAVAERLQMLKNANIPGAMLFNKSNIYDERFCQVIKAYCGK